MFVSPSVYQRHQPCNKAIVYLRYLKPYTPAGRLLVRLLPSVNFSINYIFFLLGLEFPIHLAPRFRTKELVTLKIPLPRKNENSEEMSFSRDDDIKMSFTFAEYKLIIPWTTYYDSKAKGCLKRLNIKFYHDDFDVQRISQVYFFLNLSTASPMKYLLCTKGSPVMEHILERHECPPLLVSYEWEAIQEEDLALTVIVMFVLTLIITAVLAYVTFNKHQNMVMKPKRTTSTSGPKTASGMTGSDLNRKPNESLRRPGY